VKAVSVPSEEAARSLLVRAASMTVDQILHELGTTRHGIGAAEAAARLGRVGENRLPSAYEPNLFRQFTDQLIHFFAVMLWIAAGLAFIAGMPQLGWAIIAVVLINGVFSFAQEYRAERATHALSALIPRTATTLRDGRKASVEATNLVPGDVILVREGDRISADARLIHSEGLRVDNSTLTGESEPVSRAAEEVPHVADPLDAPTLIFAGTYATSGSGTAVVFATEAHTRLGGIARLTGRVVRRPTPLRLELQRSVRIMGVFAVASGAVFFGVHMALGASPRNGFLFAVGVIVALVPEGLLPTLTLSLAAGATRMAKRRALVRHLEAVETLGATTVICTDKTGTVTANQMTVRLIATAGRRYRVSGTGYDPAGTLLADGRPLTTEEVAAVAPLVRAGALCGDARLVEEGGRWRCAGDPTEGALLVLGHKAGIQRDAAERAAPRVLEFPFESARQRMSTVHAQPSGEFEILAKGAPEVITVACARTLRNGRSMTLDADEEARILSDVETMAAEGLRVLALARRTVPSIPASADEAERDLELLGLVGLEDPVRPEVPEAIDRCRRAGIRVVMLTGDHPATATAVARKAGLDPGRVALGAELPADDAALAELLSDVPVIARVTAEQKLRIARALQARGEVVAMTGDGVNDAPALRQADIGVAMGKSGTDVAREAADLILLDDSFAHIVEAVEEGRAAFENIKRFLTYHLTDNVAELAPFLAWALSGGAIPLAISVLQILALDLGTDLLPALALGAERPEPRIMQQPPRLRRARLLDRRVLGRAFGFLGPIEASVALAMLPLGASLFFGWHAGEPLPSDGVALSTLSTLVFSAIVLMQMANAFECRSTPASLFAIRPLSNRLLAGAVVAETFALMAFVYLPPLRDALEQQALSLRQWTPLVVAPLILLSAEEARKWIARRKHPPGT